AYALIGAILLHFAGALKHHVVDKDSTLRRMLGEKPLILTIFLVCILGSLLGLYYLPRAETATHTDAAVQEVQVEAEQASAAMIEAPVSAAPAWAIAVDESFAEFTVNVEGGPFTGRFTGMAGAIAFDPANLAGSSADVRVRID